MTQMRGKNTCRILKEIRRQIAEQNDIEMVISECTYQGDCLGTCPKCEDEVRYLERELEKRQRLGKAAVISGIALTTMLGLPSCGSNAHTTQQESTQVETTTEEESDFLGFVAGEETPEFPGGIARLGSFIKENLQYPQEAIDAGIEGSVFLTFDIEEDGSVTNAKVKRGLGYGIDEEALRIVNSMPKWKPGKQGGEPAKFTYTLPIKFSLNKEENEKQ
jgi:TonB family protein